MKSPDFVENREIRIFISSTFQDMQDERTELIRRTFPRLREMASQRDVTLTEVDLRWGITKEESESGKVMEICLREVKNSIPFFIGIIGNRYGWIPAEKDVSEIVRERFPNVPRYVERQLSATEIEMQFGVLDSEENMNAFFFINDLKAPGAEDDQRWLAALKKTRLAELKKAVRENRRYPVSDFNSPEDLADQILAAFTKLLDDLFPTGELSALEKERLGQRAVLNSLTRVYIKNEANFAVIDEWMEDWEKHQLVITGESGMGKSALVAKWIKEKSSSGEGIPCRIIYHFVGYGGSVGSDWHVIKTLCDEIRDRYGFDAGENESGTDGKALDDLFKRVAAEGDKPLLIVLDGINQIIDTNHAKRLNWLPVPPRKVKILFTTLADDETMDVFKDRHYPVHMLEPMTENERIEMVRTYLKKTYSKRLTDNQLEKIVKDPQNENTLVLKTLLDEVANFGRFEELDNKIDEYLQPDSIGDFYQVVLKNYEADFGEDLVRHFLSLIAVSRNGLSEDEILGITNTKDKPILWSQFYCSFRQHLIVKNGLVSFAHGYIREAVEKRYINGCEDWIKTCREGIVAVLENNKTPDGKKTTRSMDEVPYQLNKFGDIKRLHDYLLDLDVFSYLYKNEVTNLGVYWRKLIESENYSLEEYGVQADKYNSGQPALILLELSSFTCTTVVNPSLSILFAEKAGTYASDDLQRSVVYSYLSNSYSLSNNYQRALETGETALAFRRKFFGDDHPKVANDYNNLGDIYRELGDLHKALDYLQKALEIKRSIYPDNHPAMAVSYNNLGTIYRGLGNHGKALEFCKKALEIERNCLGRNNPGVAMSYNNVSVIYLEIGEYQKALSCSEEALSIRQSLFGVNHPDVAQSYNNVGAIYGELGDYQKSLEYGKDALAIYLRIFGGNHIAVATSFSNISMTFYKLGDNIKALEYEEKALAIYWCILGNNHIDVAKSYSILSIIYRSLGDYRKVLECIKKGLDIRLGIYGENHLEIAKSYNDVGVTYEELGDHIKALEYGKKALGLFRSLLGENNASVAQSYDNISVAYESLEKHQDAISYSQQAISVYKAIMGDNNSYVARLYNNIGAIYGKMGNKKKDLEYRFKALEIARSINHHIYTAAILNRVAEAYKADNQPGKAKDYYRQAAEKYRELGNEKQAQANLKEYDNC